MTNRFLISAAVAALIAGTGLANAQGTGVSREAPAAGSTVQRDSGSTPDMKSTQSEQKSMGAEKNKRAEDQKKGGKEMKAEGKEGRGDIKGEQKGQTIGQGTMQRDQSATPQRDQTTTQGREQPMTQKDQKAQGKQDRMQTQTQGGAAGQATTTTGQAGAAGKLSTEQRTQITTVIKEQRVAPVTKVNFSIAVGIKVPRSGVTFHPLPARVVAIYPEWRGYEFILVNDQILVINPRTLEIVAILEA